MCVKVSGGKAHHHIILGGAGREGGGIDVQGRCSDVPIDDAHASVGQCQGGRPGGFLQTITQYSEPCHSLQVP